MYVLVAVISFASVESHICNVKSVRVVRLCDSSGNKERQLVSTKDYHNDEVQQ